MASNTGSSSPGELEMTFSTSEVAVCCSSASVSSRVRACTSSNSRTFSIAITAWSAKVVTSSICLSVNGCTLDRASVIDADQASPLAAEERPAPCEILRSFEPHAGCIPDRPTRRRREQFGRPGYASDHRASPRHQRMFRACTASKSRRVAVAERQADRSRPSDDGCSRCRPRTACRRFDQRVEHRLQIEGRAADDLEHVGGGGLLLQRLAQFVEQARVLDGDDRLGGEVRHQLDLLVSERATSCR